MNLDTLRSEAFSYSSRNGQGLYTSYSDINDWIEIMSRPVSILPLCEICDVLKFPGITTIPTLGSNHTNIVMHLRSNMHRIF